MKLIDKLMELNGDNEKAAEDDCPFNYPDKVIDRDTFTPCCGGDNSDCESCHGQELKAVVAENYVVKVKELFDTVLKYPKACKLIYQALSEEVIQSESSTAQWLPAAAAAEVIYPLAVAFEGFIEDEADSGFIGSDGAVCAVNQKTTTSYFTGIRHLDLDKNKTFIQFIKD